MLTSGQLNEVKNKIVETVDKLNTIYGFNLNYPNYYFDIKGTTAGIAKSLTMSVHFNEKLSKSNWKEFISTTIPHEVCHLGVFQLVKSKALKKYPAPHGATWKLMMYQVGANSKAKHNMDVTDVKQNRKKYIYKCSCEDDITVDVSIHKKIKNGYSYKCKKCGIILSDGKLKLTKKFSKESPNNTTLFEQNEDNCK